MTGDDVAVPQAVGSPVLPGWANFAGKRFHLSVAALYAGIGLIVGVSGRDMLSGAGVDGKAVVTILGLLLTVGGVAWMWASGRGGRRDTA